MFIERKRAARDVAARIGDAEPFEDALDAAVFPIGSVQRVEDHIGCDFSDRIDEAAIEIERLNVVPERDQRAQRGGRSNA